MPENTTSTSHAHADGEHDRMNEAKDKTAHALHDAADRVEHAGYSVGNRVAAAADKASSALGSTAEYVRELDSQDMMNDMKQMAKRHPGATLAMAVALGFLVGRSASR